MSKQPSHLPVAPTVLRARKDKGSSPVLTSLGNFRVSWHFSFPSEALRQAGCIQETPEGTWEKAESERGEKAPLWSHDPEPGDAGE